MPNMYFDVFINSSPWFVRQLSADYAKCYDKPNLENNLNEYIGETKLPEGYDIVDSSTIRNFFNKIINQQNSDMNLIYDNIKPWIGEYMASYIFRNNVLEYRFIVYRDYYKPLIYTLLSEDNIDICNTKMISVTNLLITMNYPEYEEITLT
jgi:hypothetical protein